MQNLTSIVVGSQLSSLYTVTIRPSIGLERSVTSYEGQNKLLTLNHHYSPFDFLGIEACDCHIL